MDHSLIKKKEEEKKNSCFRQSSGLNLICTESSQANVNQRPEETAFLNVLLLFTVLTCEKRMLLCVLPALIFHAVCKLKWKIAALVGLTIWLNRSWINVFLLSIDINLWWSVLLLIIVRPNRGIGHALRSAQQVGEALRQSDLKPLVY